MSENLCGEPRSSVSVCDTIFRSLWLVTRLPISSGGRRWVHWTSLAFAFTTQMVILFSRLSRIYKETFELRPRPLSFSNVLASIGSVFLVAYSSHVSYVLMKDRTRIESLLRRSGRVYCDVLPFLLCPIPYLVAEIRFVARHAAVLFILGGVTFAYQVLTTSVMLLVCYDTAQALLLRLRRLRISSKEPTLIWTNVISEKWKIRDQTAEINAVFALPLAEFYMQYFLSIIYFSAEAIKDDMVPFDSYVMSVNMLSVSLLFFMLARKSSEIRSQCVETQATLMKRLDANTTLSGVDFASMIHFQFSEDWDSLRCGCFALSMSNFLRYLSMVFTSTAVVLQFDYHVIRKINTLSAMTSDTG